MINYNKEGHVFPVKQEQRTDSAAWTLRYITVTAHKVVSIQDLFQANVYFRLNGSHLNEVSIMPNLSLSYV